MTRGPVPGWMLTVATAAVVVLIGGGVMLLIGGDEEPAVAPASEGTVPGTVETTSTTPTSAASSSSPAPREVAATAVVYLLSDAELIPVARPVTVVPDDPHQLLLATVEVLLEGPTAEELQSVPEISSAIPDGTRLLDLTVEGGVASVDLSTEFTAGSGSFAEIARLEQLVYTLTRFGPIDGVRLKIDGSPVEVFGGHGIVLDEPMARTDLDTTLPAILIETPPFTLEPGVLGGDHPLAAAGTANVFEATVSLALTDADGLIIWEGFTTATCGTGCRGDWSIEIPYEIATSQRGALIAWEESMQDGSQLNAREHPVWLVLPASP